ncbi:MAG: tetratricopeptide repeat protein [Calditrichaeota bacterium]|nr:tetratricopeptide repeat protein [Calditrichota bacterium]
MRVLSKRVKELEELYERNSETPHFAHLADCYIELGKLDLAIEILEAGVAKRPYDSIAHFILGKCYYLKEDYKNAKSELDRSLKYFPANVQARRLLIEINKLDGMTHVVESLEREMYSIHPFLHAQSEFNMQARPDQTADIDSSFEVFDDQIEDEFLEAESKTETVEAEQTTDDTLDDFEFDRAIDQGQNQEAMETEEKSVLTEINEAETAAEIDLDENVELDQKEEGTLDPEPVKEAAKESNDDFDFDFAEFQTKTIDPQSLKENELVEEEIDLSNNDPVETESDEDSDVDFDFLDANAESRVKKVPDFLNREPAKSDQTGKTDTDKSVFADDESLDDELNLLQNEKKSKLTEQSTQSPKIVSSTLGEIYLSQGKFSEAKAIFQELIKKDPTNEKLQRKLRDIESLIESN